MIFQHKHCCRKESPALMKLQTEALRFYGDFDINYTGGG